jgi:hypothetical protein
LFIRRRRRIKKTAKIKHPELTISGCSSFE